MDKTVTLVPELPTRGALGSLGAQAFLAALSTQKVSGTLYLARADERTLLTLKGGEPHARADFGSADGAAFDLGETGGQFSFWPHAVTATHPSTPTWPSRYPDRTGPLWALPVFTEHPLLSTAETELRGLVSRLAADAFTGALVLGAPHAELPTYGLLLFQEGRLGGAVCETVAQTQAQIPGGSAALRTLVQLEAALTLHALPEPVVAGLLGWLLGLQLSDTADENGVPEGFSGLELTPAAARYYRAGSAYLQLSRPAGQAAPATGLFAACQRAPSLFLPSKSHGWEARRYGLTLRGRDALNPMTELAMRFRSDFGPVGRRILEAFRRELSAGAAAETLALAPDDLKSVVERLEHGGFIRPIRDAADGAPGPSVSDLSPTSQL